MSNSRLTNLPRRDFLGASVGVAVATSVGGTLEPKAAVNSSPGKVSSTATEGSTVDASRFGVRIQHAGIHVASIEETAKWYHDVFGFELASLAPSGGSPSSSGGGPFSGGVFPKMRVMSLGNFNIEVYEVPAAEPFNLVDFEYKQGLKHLSFAIKDISGWVEYIKKRDDVEIVVENDYGGAVAIYLKDNNGILVEVTSEM